MEPFEGTFEFVSSYGVDSYLGSLGVGHVLRKVHSRARPVLEITRIQEPKTWNYKISSPLYTHEVELKPDQGVDDVTLDSRPCQTILVIHSYGVVLRQIPTTGPEVKVSLTKHAGDKGLITISHNAGNKRVCSYDFKRCSKV